MKNVGVILCTCGGTLGGVIKFDEVKKFAEEQNGVVSVVLVDKLCNEDAKKAAEELKGKVDALVVLACSPQIYGDVIREKLGSAGLSVPIEFVNIREHCAWPHKSDGDGATRKAKVLLAAALARISETKGPETRVITPKNAALVIGGGVAGIRAAVDLSNAGVEVFLVEKSPTLGGIVSNHVDLFPSFKSPQDLLKQLYQELKETTVHVITCAEVEKIEGQPGDFKVTIKVRPRGVDPEKCTLCGECAKVCPVEVPDDLNLGLSKRKAIYLPSKVPYPEGYAIDFSACTKCGKCVEACKQNAISLDGEEKEITVNVGAILIATGMREADPSKYAGYNYGKIKSMVTQFQLERMLDPEGPTGGKVIRPDTGEEVKRVLMALCTGSRTVEDNPYCSRICCTYALKHAIKLRERGIDVIISYMDIRSPFFAENLYQKAREMGVIFIRGDLATVDLDPETKKPVAYLENTITGQIMAIETDLVVLTPTLKPNAAGFLKGLKMPRKLNEFLQSLYAKVRPTDTRERGIFLCGTAYTPMFVSDAIVHASAAAERALKFLRNGIPKETYTPAVREELCSQCGACEEVCPFGAPKLVNGKPVIDVTKCNGCGICAALCPTGALQLRDYERGLLFKQIEAVLRTAKSLDNESPKVIAFCCEECAYATLDLLGITGKEYPSYVYPIMLPCAGRVSLLDILKALAEGADAVLVIACGEKSCHYLDGSVRARRMVAFAKEVLKELGYDPDKLGYVDVVSVETDKLLNSIRAIVDAVKKG
ncbi:MAG: hydrogenase iron-sulfur subunit [Candidatus Baldrarchaeia archaeon]